MCQSTITYMPRSLACRIRESARSVKRAGSVS
jgi:hypothetical protein